MKASLFALVLVCVFAVAACTSASESQSPAPKTPSISAGPLVYENDEAVITQLEHDWAAALVKKDRTTLDRLLAEDFNGTSESGHTFTKEMAIDDLERGVYVVDAMDLDEISVNLYGNAAVAFTSQEEKSKYNGENFSGHYHYTDTWIKDENGVWRIVASHGSRFN